MWAAPVDYDVVIVGAGISGINMAYRLQERNPDLTYCILEARHEVGGTWSLFKYPGIRSDSDLFTFGFAWRPWVEKESIAKGSVIKNYLEECAEQQGIDKNIKFNHKVSEMHWSTDTKTWSLDLTVNESTSATLRSRFVFFGTGYYDYEEPLKTEIPGIDNFKGIVIHPQFWPEDLNYKDKDVVVIGSGATAVTLLPSMAEDAKHVTMLQRSPSYILSIPGIGWYEKVARFLLPPMMAHRLIRFKWQFLVSFLITFCKTFPWLATKVFLRRTKQQLPKGAELDPNYTPSYAPWDQRMCLCPDGDFYASVRSGKTSVTTGVIDTVTAKSIKLKSGKELNPDIIITATGLKLRVGGGINISVDNKPYSFAGHYVWKTCMLEDLPNAAFAFGYVDASWTLGADATAQLVCRMLTQMKKDGANAIIPRRSEDDKENMQEVPMVRLSSTYVQKANSVLPKNGDRTQWQPRSYYWKDLFRAKWGNINSNIEYVR